MRDHFALLALFGALLAAASSPGVARAGGCTPCTTSAECVASTGAPAFCIAWDDTTSGCASTPIQCCPGQGCDTFSGRPSCESEGRCHVIDDSDAGTSAGTDAGTSTGSDAGTGTDTGPSAGTDAGTSSGTDAGTSTGMDAGTTTGSSGGCHCRVGHGASPTGALALLGLVLAAVVARRR